MEKLCGILPNPAFAEGLIPGTVNDHPQQNVQDQEHPVGEWAANDDNSTPIRLYQTVLVVEDSATARTMLEVVLVAAGYQVKTASDGVEGQKILTEDTVDVVLSDIDMPRADGWSLIRYIRSQPRLQHLPFIFLTGLHTCEDRQRGIEAGANEYLFKESFRTADLLTVIRRFIK